MNLKNTSINLQLKLGFALILLLVIVLGFCAYLQTNKIHEHTETLYRHPLNVRFAIGSLSNDIEIIHKDLKDFLLVDSDKDRENVRIDIEQIRANAFAQIDSLYLAYLGEKSDIDSVKLSFIKWNVFIDETVDYLNVGNVLEGKLRLLSNGIVSIGAKDVINHIECISKFAYNKANTLLQESRKERDILNLQLFFIVIGILIFSLLVIFIITKNISEPLSELTRATREFKLKNFKTRSNYTNRNEFGTLSDAFNELAQIVQESLELSDKNKTFSELVILEDDSKRFFNTTLTSLMEHTDSQIGAVYLLSDDKKRFEHFDSIGTNENARNLFLADSFEGEFGIVLAKKEFVHQKDIPQDTRFTFNTVTGSFIPRDIITIPIISDKAVVAIISLASVHEYDKTSLEFMENIQVVLSARIASILGIKKTKQLAEILKNQNSELVAQQSELTAQSAELTEQNRELEIQKQQLDEAGRLKTSFLSNMSHELRTPLNSVIALSGVLNRRCKDFMPAEEYGYIEIIERNGKMLLALINDILDIARIESGKEEIDSSLFSVLELVDEIVAMIKPQADQKAVSLVHKKNEAPVNIESDRGKCRHILQNVIANAIKFTEKGGVEVIVRQDNDHIEIEVFDTGIGIASENLSKIFDEFKQADSSTSRRYGGTGLGLSIAKKYAHVLGGIITVTSEVGKGSTFKLSLPNRFTGSTTVQQSIYHIVKKPQQSIDIKTTASQAKNVTVLLVEDSEPAIIQVRDILENQGFKVVVARGGKEALAVIENIIPDAMILDLMMPGIDGFSVLKTIREVDRTSHVPVLILTAKQITKEELSFLTRNNIYQLIQKGDVNRDELLGAIRGMTQPQKKVVAPLHKKIRKNAGKPRVLVVEDNPDNMVTIKALLDKEYEILEAHDGNEGIAKAKKLIPDLIFMDISLPEKDGIQAFEAIRNNAETSHIPVIVITASAMVHDRETILAYGFDAYIAKPIDAQELYKCIKEVLYGN